MKQPKGPKIPTQIFCVICGGYHDRDVSCFDQTQQALKDLGIPKKKRPASPKIFNRLVQKADNFIIIALLIIIVFFLFLFVMAVIK